MSFSAAASIQHTYPYSLSVCCGSTAAFYFLQNMYLNYLLSVSYRFVCRLSFTSLFADPLHPIFSPSAHCWPIFGHQWIRHTRGHSHRDRFHCQQHCTPHLAQCPSLSLCYAICIRCLQRQLYNRHVLFCRHHFVGECNLETAFCVPKRGNRKAHALL